ncbi:hypothetical protein M9H77_17478 [Catharanthus roseus]|uniref:Uncharacterized protein n=1 Tax=Catharanthus roseus TaxID=4058 RepID=A0ACC0B4N9_CATRO|nr:hypothetical protein M9H77_17478 [Catharanthus roseus]
MTWTVRLWRVEPLERRHSIIEGLAPLVLRLTFHHALCWDERLVESQEELETKVGLRVDLFETIMFSARDMLVPYLAAIDLVEGLEVEKLKSSQTTTWASVLRSLDGVLVP